MSCLLGVEADVEVSGDEGYSGDVDDGQLDPVEVVGAETKIDVDNDDGSSDDDEEEDECDAIAAKLVRQTQNSQVPALTDFLPLPPSSGARKFAWDEVLFMAPPNKYEKHFECLVTSIWYPCNLVIRGVKYSSLGQYYAAKLAQECEQQELEQLIMETQDTNSLKRWYGIAEDMFKLKSPTQIDRFVSDCVRMTQGLLLKFEQCPEFAQFLDNAIGPHLDRHRIVVIQSEDCQWGAGQQQQAPQQAVGGAAAGGLPPPLAQQEAGGAEAAAAAAAGGPPPPPPYIPRYPYNDIERSGLFGENILGWLMTVMAIAKRLQGSGASLAMLREWKQGQAVKSGVAFEVGSSVPMSYQLAFHLLYTHYSEIQGDYLCRAKRAEHYQKYLRGCDYNLSFMGEGLTRLIDLFAAAETPLCFRPRHTANCC